MTEFIQALNEAPPEIFDSALLGELRRRNAGNSATFEP
jgi:hypothetical protein